MESTFVPLLLVVADAPAVLLLAAADTEEGVPEALLLPLPRGAALGKAARLATAAAMPAKATMRGWRWGDAAPPL